MQVRPLRELGGLRAAFWVAMLAFSALLVRNALPYFSFAPDLEFLREKDELARETAWRACFHAHVFGGLIALATGPVLLSSVLLRRAAWLHRVLGRAYVMAVLGCAGPAGFYLALHARGGVAGQLGFLLLGAAWCGATLRGVELVLRGRMAAHRRWMVRSYALTLSAVFFRILHVALYLAGVGDGPNYVISLWASLGASLYAGEVLARAPVALSTAKLLDDVNDVKATIGKVTA